jgi:hypothetical protein
MTDWTPPAPGPWQQDSAHMPAAQTAVMAELYPDGFNRGFTETFNRYGMLLDRLAMAQVNGFTYHQPQPFDMPGPDGPMSPEDIGVEFGRRATLAEESFAVKRWRRDLDLWDNELRPLAIARHRELGDTEIGELSDTELVEHLDVVRVNLTEMVYQHHRMNVAALLPVGDLALHVARWTGLPPTEAFGLLDGYSPVSGVAPSEMEGALAAIRGDETALVLLSATDDAEARLDQLRAAQPPVDNYVRTIQDRVIEGFDIVNTTLREQPAVVLAKLAAGLEGDPNASCRLPMPSQRRSVNRSPSSTVVSSTSSSTRRERCIGSATSEGSTATSSRSVSFDASCWRSVGGATSAGSSANRCTSSTPTRRRRCSSSRGEARQLTSSPSVGNCAVI